jgi:hypothetical protein
MVYVVQVQPKSIYLLEIKYMDGTYMADPMVHTC